MRQYCRRIQLTTKTAPLMIRRSVIMLGPCGLRRCPRAKWSLLEPQAGSSARSVGDIGNMSAPSVATRVGRDILVDSEDVLGVVLRLQFRKPGVIAPVSGLHPSRSLVHHVVDVSTARRVWMHR